MTVSLLRPPSSLVPPPRTESPPLRLALRHAAGSGPSVGALDGAWWPRSDDLLRELPSLVAVLDREWGRITRVDVNPTTWQPLPREVPAQAHLVKVGRFAEQDPHKLLLVSYRTGRWDLLVIPPHTGQASAGRLMAAASDPAGAPSASALIAAEGSRLDGNPPSRDTGAEAAWESEGGAPLPVPLSMPIGRVHVSRGR
ncbi:hypothetical protein DN069_11475 [Streptacidiphilus pinicola]|uniref:Uncharacterized protein n=1 Tax=Streptacidiphilus pinicola TaxID=2219663 RepID=A0A2X0JD51_9ACTN|nr:DUF5994 family protein [Streptacidiphilus pinicola]RAG85548.1 hypothetical protein DN069_11475 [Streptacidiphilus pinicola]